MVQAVSKLHIKTHCIWCKEPFGPGKGRSKEHVIPKTLGGTFSVHYIHQHCNEKLGQRYSLLSNDYWINRGKEAITLQGASGQKISPSYSYDGRLEKLLLLPLPNGKVKLVQPEAPPISTYETIATMSFQTAALGVGSEIFDSAFDDLRGFIENGKPDLVEKTQNGIYRAFHNRNWRPEHRVTFEFDRPNLVIGVLLFNNYLFSTFVRLDKPLEVFDFEIIQLLHPNREAGLFVRDKKDKLRFVRSLVGLHF